jgi:hypothetical protein
MINQRSASLALFSFPALFCFLFKVSSFRGHARSYSDGHFALDSLDIFHPLLFGGMPSTASSMPGPSKTAQASSRSTPTPTQP